MTEAMTAADSKLGYAAIADYEAEYPGVYQPGVSKLIESCFH